MPGVGNQFTSHELGYPFPAPSPVGGVMPPGGGRYSVPHFLSFPSLVTTAARTYRYTTDEALRDNRFNALAMRRDCVLFAALRARQMPTAQLSWTIEPRDETDPAEIEAASLVTEIIESIPRFQVLKMQLLEAVWFGKYAIELAYQWENWRGRQVLTVRDHAPIQGDKLRFRWDGTPGILVYASYPGTKEATDFGLAHFLDVDGDRQQYIIHEHEPDDVDWTEAEMAGAVHGVGLRGRLYWFWWLKQQVFGLLMNYLERFANGLTIIYYAAHDPAAQTQAQAMARAEYTNNTVLIPRWSSEQPDLNKIERLEVSTASPALLQNLVTEYFDNVMVRAILGQTLSSIASSTGMNEGISDLHGETLDQIIKYDAVNLQETMQADLIKVLYRYNCPGVRPGLFKFAIDSPNSKEVLGYAQALFEMGVGLDEDQLLELAQLQKPKPGGAVVSKIGAMQAAAAAEMPMGVPVAGGNGYTQPSGYPPQVGGGGNGQAAMAYRRSPFNGKYQMVDRYGRPLRRELPRRVLMPA